MRERQTPLFSLHVSIVENEQSVEIPVVDEECQFTDTSFGRMVCPRTTPISCVLEKCLLVGHSLRVYEAYAYASLPPSSQCTILHAGTALPLVPRVCRNIWAFPDFVLSLQHNVSKAKERGNCCRARVFCGFFFERKRQLQLSTSFSVFFFVILLFCFLFCSFFSLVYVWLLSFSGVFSSREFSVPPLRHNFRSTWHCSEEQNPYSPCAMRGYFRGWL